MLAEIWQKTSKLLLLFYFESPVALKHLNPALEILEQALPNRQIELLVMNWNNYVAFEFLDIRDIDSFLVPRFKKESLEQVVQMIQERAFDGAIILTTPDQSPYALAYLAYLAGIPIRLGQSQEFGGGVLSSCITPPRENVSLGQYYLHLLQSIGIAKEVTVRTLENLAIFNS